MAPTEKDAEVTGPYSGPNPHTKYSQAWHGWNYLQKTVEADRKAGIKVDKLPKGWTSPDHPDHDGK